MPAPANDRRPSTQGERAIEELERAGGPVDAATIRAVLEDACGGQWPTVVDDWMTNMGPRSPAVIVYLALRLRAGTTLSAEACAVLPPEWVAAAYTLNAQLTAADQRRNEHMLALLPRRERGRRLDDGYRRLVGAAGASPVDADVLAMARRARRRVGRRVERFARLAAFPSRPRVLHAAPRRRRVAGRRAREPGRPGSDDGGDARARSGLAGSPDGSARECPSWL